MINRFEGCKTLVGLQQVLGGEGVKFSTLTEDEMERLFAVFTANAPDYARETIEFPMTEAGFEFICDVVEEEVIKIAAEELHNGKGGFTMNKNIFTNTDEAVKNAVNAAANAISTATANVRVRAGEDVESFKDKADASITIIKDATFSALGVLDRLTGASTLKDDILHILYKNSERGSKRGFFDAASECRRLVYEHIAVIMSYDPDEDDLKEVAALRYLVGEDENGKPINGHRSIFAAFANGVVWIAKKVARKFRAWFGVDAESNIFGTIGASLASIFGMVVGVIGSVLKVAFHAVVFVGSYAVSAIIKAISFVWDNLKKAISFAKTKFSKKDAEDDAADDEALKAEAQADAK